MVCAQLTAYTHHFHLCTLNAQVEEVPVDGDGAGGYSVGTLDKPTTRLSQYARGKTGSMNPFTPGGEVSYSSTANAETRLHAHVCQHQNAPSFDIGWCLLFIALPVALWAWLR